jgi:Sulfotransferase domain
LPAFIIGGAPRSGTTWLWTLLNGHPGIGIAQSYAPEPKFFLVDELYERGLEYYSKTWFETLPQGVLLGEKSANYLESPVVPERIHRDLPGVKLIFILRNPVDRAYSNYLWSKQNGWETESFERALELEEERERSYSAPNVRFARPYSFFSRGLYIEFLQRFYDRFPSEQILVLRSEDIAIQPVELARTVFSFLGVAPIEQGIADLGPINATLDKSTQMSASTRELLARRYSEPNRRLAALLGDRFEIWND